MKFPKVELISKQVTCKGVEITTYGLKRGKIEVMTSSQDVNSMIRLINAINEVGDVADEHLADIVADSIN